MSGEPRKYNVHAGAAAAQEDLQVGPETVATLQKVVSQMSTNFRRTHN